MNVAVCIYVCVLCVGLLPMAEPLELEFQAVVSCLIWALERGLYKSSAYSSPQTQLSGPSAVFYAPFSHFLSCMDEKIESICFKILLRPTHTNTCMALAHTCMHAHTNTHTYWRERTSLLFGFLGLWMLSCPKALCPVSSKCMLEIQW